jgi:hypothetical protein
MIRQVWGARVLQSGGNLPDCDANDHWTFTLFPCEALIDGDAESGTVLKGKVRFHLGQPDRGIGSARAAPAISIP